LVGASSVKQLEDNVGALKNMEFSGAELNEIEMILSNRKSYQIIGGEKGIQDDKTPSRGEFILNLAKKIERREFRK
jgi:hypothetical protein